MNPKITQIAIFSLLFGLFVQSGSAQTLSMERLKSTLSETAGFGPEDFARIEKGNIVIKTLKSDMKREVAVVGLVKITGPNEIVLRAFHRTIELQERKTSKQYGEFGKKPALSDLNGLTIDKGELLDLKSCRVDSCNWNLPANLIERISDEIDWNAEAPEADADKLIRKILIDYVIDYSENGDQALFEYNDKPAFVNLKNEYGELTKQMFWLDELAPELASYLDNYPDNEPKGIEATFNWSNIKIGLKPVIIITHNTTYLPVSRDQPVSFVISKQLYANHYFDSTLAQTVAISYPAEDGGFETYLMFLNRSRAGAFKGMLGKLARGIVESQAESRLEAVLKNTKKYTALALANRIADAEALEFENNDFGFVSATMLYSAAGIVVLLILAGWMIVRLGRKGR